MAKNYRTAQGKMLDITALAARNENVRAVGNAKLNARGDTIDSAGRVITPVTQKVGEAYQKTVSNKGAQVKKVSKPIPNPQLTQEEIELENSLDNDLEVEKIKEKETKKK